MGEVLNAKDYNQDRRQTDSPIGLDWRDCFDQSCTPHWPLNGCSYRDIVFALKQVEERLQDPIMQGAMPLSTTP